MARILVIEDDATTANAICNGLRGEGYDTALARTGEDGFFQDQSAHEQFCSTAGFARKWPQFWHHGPWNEFGARITGCDMPTITTWINGVKFMEWTETE